MKTARSAYRCDSFSTSSTTGPQNLLVQYTGVANATSAGRPWAIASAIVHRCRSLSGTDPSVVARESIAAGGTSFDARVRLSVFGARWPGAGSAGSATTGNADVTFRAPPPSTSAVAVTCQVP